MRAPKSIVATLFLLFCAGVCAAESRAELFLHGDHIATVDTATAGATAVVVSDGTITHVGRYNDLSYLIDASTRVVDLGERALLPGFIDSHGHLAATARFIDYANLSFPPVGNVTDIDTLVTQFQRHFDQSNLEAGQWLIGYGYDDSLLKENRHPTRNDLDKVSKTIPIYLAHVSGHLGVVNSAALTEMGIDGETPNPAGGVIRRDANGRANGVLEETAAMHVFQQQLLQGNSDLERKVRAAIALYASYGITTIQDGGASAADIELFTAFASKEPFAVDVAAYNYLAPDDESSIQRFKHQPGYRDSGYRAAGIKFALDGSPQGRTAWMRAPYAEGPEGVEADYVAYSTVTPEAYAKGVQAVLSKKIPMLVHANGDAAIQLMLDGLEDVVTNMEVEDHRSVIIHAQLMGLDQVKQALRVGAVPSFFASHTYFWGDWHLRSFGAERGENISPTGWARAEGVPFTVHNDMPVVPPDMLRLLWATTNRITRSGRVIGGSQRLSVEDGLYALTQAGAFQLFEESIKGSISVGKQADLIILNKDPRETPVEDLGELFVEETFARGRSVFRLH